VIDLAVVLIIRRAGRRRAAGPGGGGARGGWSLRENWLLQICNDIVNAADWVALGGMDFKEN